MKNQYSGIELPINTPAASYKNTFLHVSSLPGAMLMLPIKALFPYTAPADPGALG